ncbi:MAG: glycerophosphodiester phosphodiesterase [Candidatus Saccharimonadales bacterium]|jgi:glycerophosphoryl diester phosphodiesterase
MTKIYGHRGARGLAPENTIKAIEAALAHHVDGVEIDVRVTKDGIVVLSHDPTLEGLVVRKQSYAALKKRKPDLATLEEAIASVRLHSALLIEIKPKVPVEPIAQIVRHELSMNNQADISVLSRSQSVLKQVQAALPGIQLVVNERWSIFIALWRMRRLGTDRLQMNQRLLSRTILWAIHKNGIRMSPYTVNSPKQAMRWEPYLYGIITDYPDRFEKK